MIAYGWTSEQIQEAVEYVNGLYVPEGGIAVTTRNLEIKALCCGRGNSTIKVNLEFGGSTAKREDGTYPPGVNYRAWVETTLLPKQPVPTLELINTRSTCAYVNGCEVVSVERTRSNGSLCWHAFGHFMAKLFDSNAQGKI